MGKLVFITGTDTGIGKTIFTAAFLSYLRNLRFRAWALKPFCSGGRSDAHLFHRLQDRELDLDLVNPVYFDEALAPLVAARRRRRTIEMAPILNQIKALRQKCDWLLVEGCGGALVPLTETHTVLDFIQELRCPAIVVARNRLGAINHILLTLRALSQAEVRVVAVVLTEPPKQTLVTKTNRRLLAEMVKPATLVPFNNLGRNTGRPESIKKSLGKVKKKLARLLNADSLSGV